MTLLEIKNLYVEIEGNEILKRLNLTIKKGSVHALMGPNGSGKSTLANVIMGNPKYYVVNGKILFEGKNITNLEVNERAKIGIFLSFQYPQEIEGVTMKNFLRTAYQNLHGKIPIIDFNTLIKEKSKLLNLDEKFSERYLNKGFSGGEKKKSEILQLVVLNPKLAILDETDSGLDIDSLKTIAKGINILKKINPEMTILIITHYKRILEYLKPDKISIMMKGRIVLEGNTELVDHLEEKGYGWIEEE
ncbi:MAG: Fe-S cluster assembly ATPase SufC [Thermoplasmata archaeon]